MRIKKLLYILLICLMVGAPVLCPIKIYGADYSVEELQKSIKQKQDQIKAAQEERKKLESQLNDVKNMVGELKNSRKSLQDYVVSLDTELEKVQARIQELKDLISEKENQITEAESDLEEAIEVQNKQYDSMKKRIKFMYEKGDNFFVNMIFTSGSFGDMLNKADYASKLAKYDNDLLEEYKATCEYIELVKQELTKDKQVLDAAKVKVDEEEEGLQTIIKAKETEIRAITEDVNNKEAAAKDFEDDLAAQTAVISTLEAAIAAEKAKLAEAGNALKYDGGMFTWPAPSYVRISDDYGYRIHPILGVKQFHSGVDMAAPGGSPILAAYDGKVVAAAYNSSMGNYIMIDHGDGLYTIYMHCSSLLVGQGQTVSKGSKIGTVGTTGRSTGNHLHFGVRLNGNYVNPWTYLKG